VLKTFGILVLIGIATVLLVPESASARVTAIVAQEPAASLRACHLGQVSEPLADCCNLWENTCECDILLTNGSIPDRIDPKAKRLRIVDCY